MRNELADRQLAIQLRLAGASINAVSPRLQRAPAWVSQWWSRYGSDGPEGRYDLSRTPRTLVDRLPPPIERRIIRVRRRRAAPATPETRDQHIGAPTIQAELNALQLLPLPAVGTIARVVPHHGMTSPRLRTAPLLPRSVYPAPSAEDSNQLHQIDFVGPIYLKGQRQRWYIYVCNDVFDHAVYLKLAPSRQMDPVLLFRIEAWQRLGLPAQAQFDHARELAGWGTPAHALSRVIRLCLYLHVTPSFIPPGRPQRHGAVENFNGWFQPLLFQHTFKRPAAWRRERTRRLDTVYEHPVQPHLSYRTIAPYRRRQRWRKLPAQFKLDLPRRPRSEGRVVFIRTVFHPPGRPL